MIVILREGDSVVVNMAVHDENGFRDGSFTLTEQAELFGKPLSGLKDGIYADDGTFVTSFDDYYKQLVDGSEE